MKLLQFTFEESQYLVDESFIKRHTTSSSYKRFWGMFVLTMVIYLSSLLFSLLVNYFSNNGTVKSFNTWNIPVLAILLAIYLAYVILSLINRKKFFVKKYLTTLYYFFIGICFAIVTAVLSIVLTYFDFGIVLAIAIALLLIITIVYTQRKLRQGIAESIENKTVFNSFSHLAAEKGTQWLILLGGSGITAAGAIANIATGGDFNRMLNKFMSPFIGFLGYFMFYFFFLEALKGYYIFKYYQEFKEIYPDLA